LPAARAAKSLAESRDRQLGLPRKGFLRKLAAVASRKNPALSSARMTDTLLYPKLN
jgi:hypothetical protein